MRNVYDYIDIRRLRESSINDDIRNGVLITATKELADAMTLFYEEYKILDVHYFLRNLVPEWKDNVKDVKNYVILRNVIEEYISESDTDDKSIEYLRRNTGDIWNAIKLLIEADVYPDDIETGDSILLMHFKNIWRKLETANDLIMMFRTKFAFGLPQSDELINVINKCTGKDTKDIFLLGFYFITPIQQRIIDAIEKSGYSISYLNCHDSNYSYATSIWDKTFCEEYDSGNARFLQENIVLDNHFGNVLLGKQDEFDLQIIKHHNDYDFAEMIKKAFDNGEAIYSPDSKRCEKILKEYYPECYNKKHLLSYPVGQYIYYLHMMWNVLSQELDLRYEYVYKCFASGWLAEEQTNGIDYLYEFKVLEPCFKWSHSKDDWMDSLDKLLDAKASVKAFEERKKGSDRWHRLLGDPFYNVGIYSIPSDHVEKIAQLIKKLIRDAEELFGSEKKTDLYEHFSRISNLIRSHISQFDKDSLLEEENQIANELLSQLNDKTTKGVICPLSVVRDAIIMLIGDHSNDYESLDDETSSNDGMVLPISMVEAAMLKKTGPRIHLVMADEFALPGQPTKLPWPLTDKMLDELKISGRHDTKRYVESMRSIIVNRPLSYMYLFFSYVGAVNNQDSPSLSIEWVAERENKVIGVSPYVQLFGLEDRYIDVKANYDDYKKIIESSEDVLIDDSVNAPDEKVPDEVRMDYLLCKKRYVYSYIVNYLPRYTSEFHYSFELTKLIESISIVSGIDKEIISDRVFELFPFLRGIEQRQSKDFASTRDKYSPYVFDDVEYPHARLKPHYLNNLVVETAIKLHDDYLDGKITPEKPDEHLCIYCPYSDICFEQYEREEPIDE